MINLLNSSILAISIEEIINIKVSLGEITMKEFHQWVAEMQNTIEDASIIRKDANGNIVSDTIQICKYCGQDANKEKINPDYYGDWD